jgi:hypothetical protein
MNICKQAAELFGPYLYGSVSPAEAALLENHCEACESCRRNLEECRQATGLLTPAMPTAEERERILRGVRKHLAADAPKPRAYPGRRSFQVAGAGALAVILFVAGLWVGAGLRPIPPVSQEIAAGPGSAGKIPRESLFPEKENRDKVPPEEQSLRKTAEYSRPRERKLNRKNATYSASAIAPIPLGGDDIRLAAVRE